VKDLDICTEMNNNMNNNNMNNNNMNNNNMNNQNYNQQQQNFNNQNFNQNNNMNQQNFNQNNNMNRQNFNNNNQNFNNNQQNFNNQQQNNNMNRQNFNNQQQNNNMNNQNQENFNNNNNQQNFNNQQQNNNMNQQNQYSNNNQNKEQDLQSMIQSNAGGYEAYLFSLADADGNGNMDIYEFGVFMEMRKCMFQFVRGDFKNKQFGNNKVVISNAKLATLVNRLSGELWNNGVPQGAIEIFRQNALNVVSGKQMTTDSGESYQSLFKTADTNNNGSINMQEFAIFLALQDAMQKQKHSGNQNNPYANMSEKDLMAKVPPKNRSLVQKLAAGMKDKGVQKAAIIGFIGAAGVAAAGTLAVGRVIAYKNRNKIKRGFNSLFGTGNQNQSNNSYSNNNRNNNRNNTGGQLLNMGVGLLKKLF